MSYPPRNNMGKEAVERTPLPPTTTHSLSRTLQQLSISTESSTALPSSSQSSSPARSLSVHNNPRRSASPNGRLPSRSPFQRSPSSMSIDTRSSTPPLRKKASMNSLHGMAPQNRTPSRASLSRRSSSSSFANGSAMVGKSPLAEAEEEVRPRHTAESIASNYFKAELEAHSKDTARADTIVILHDACYGHRYSRPRTTKANLSTIVERPERIHASILGVSVAYVRLGERHMAGQYPPNRGNSPPVTAPFRIQKTARKVPVSSAAVTNVHGVKWMEELKIMCDAAEAKLSVNGKELTRPEMTRSPGENVQKFHEGDLYLCAESLDAMEGALGAVCEGVDAVFEGSATDKGPHRTFVAIRPPGHHCSASYPSGFCWLNNVHVGISHATLAHGLTHAAIIDFDLHHGDGSQAIAWAHNQRANILAKNASAWKKSSIGYFSLHDINSYPCEYGDEEKVKMASLCIENAHGQNIWNVHLQPWKSEAEFWELYETRYSILLEKTRNYLHSQTERLRLAPNGPKPKGAIFLSAGFDASEWESDGMQRHKVNVPTEFYARLTRDVVKIAAEEGSAVDGRVISVLEGGYSDRALCTGVFSHLSGLAGGDPIAIAKEFKIDGLGYEMGNRIGTFDGLKKDEEPFVASAVSYDPLWWALPQLEQLDATVHSTAKPEPKNQKDGIAPTYSSPTQSFINKVSSPTARRAVSNMAYPTNGSPRQVSRASSPPPPQVDWTVAAHQLSKLLIPADRQTMSCKIEDLSAAATKARRDRQSVLIPPANVSSDPEPSGGRMALRTRKPAKYVEPEDEAMKPVTKANRRKTLAGASVIAAEKAMSRSTTPIPMPEPRYAQPTTQSTRRLSVASSSGSTVSETPTVYGNDRKPSGRVPSLLFRSASQTARPDSSISSRGSSIPPPTVVIKKTRAPAQPKAEPAKTTRVRKKSPLTGSGLAKQDRPAAVSPPSSVVFPSIEPSQDSAMDNLISGMSKTSLGTNGNSNDQAKPEAKKVKITLLTKPQREAKDKAKIAANASDIASKDTAGPVDTSTVPAPSSLLPVAPTPTLPSTPLTSHNEATEMPLPPMTPQEPTIVHEQPPTDVFVAYQPEGSPATAMTQHAPIQWLPPNSATPATMNPELPVFTSTSAIPFGPRPEYH
ncbi:hypothetical protein BJ878DRAFT_489669 [Calycina marina]|uniref:Histone deacetylase domain-containing protein n=1 Tax=Calycina marina TaxID=1763456 RepID=A0A9P8CIS1_9HELO|nr:hypothetical protein BJ878DRAFT_489669 [Calycina marina]